MNGKAHGEGEQKGKIAGDLSSQYLELALGQIRDLSGGDDVADHMEVLHGEFSYKGSFADDEMCGTGQFTFPNGDMYDGEWQHGYAHGHGMFRWANGDMYQGEFRCMMKHGMGSYIFKDGTKYDGRWKDNKRHGWGNEHFAKNGNRYEGYFCHDLRHGMGYYYVNHMHSDSHKKGKKNKGKMSGKNSSRSSSPNLAPLSPSQLSSSHHTIVETVWDFGKLVSQQEINAAPTVPPPEPKELKDDTDRALEQIDILMKGKEVEEDNVFVEGILHWSDPIWFTVENLFVDVYVERVRHKTLQEQLADMERVEKLQERVPTLTSQLEKLQASLASRDLMKNALLQCMGSADESLPDDSAEEEVFRQLVENKMKVLAEELQEITGAKSKMLEKHGGSKQGSKLKEEIIELEKKLFRIDSSTATARLHGSSVAITVDVTSATYKNVMKLIRTFLTRLAFVAEKLVLLRAGESGSAENQVDDELANYAILQKANTLFCQELEMKSEFKTIGCDVRRTMNRSNKLVQMTIDKFEKLKETSQAAAAAATTTTASE